MRKKKFLACLLSLAMALTLLPMTALADGATAGGTPAETTAQQVGTIAELTAAAAAGGEIQLTGDITLSETLKIAKNTTIDANSHTLTITPASGDAIDYAASGVGLTLKNGSVVLQASGTAGTDRGIYSAFDSCCLTLDHAAVQIKDFSGYGIYSFGKADACGLTMTGGSLNIQNCGTSSGEGGIDWEGGSMTFNSGTVDITGCGSTLFGALYSTAETTFGDGGTDPLTVNLENNPNATSVKNALVLSGGKNLTIRNNATVDIALSGHGVSSEGTTICRGINVGPGGSKITVDGTLNIHKGTTTAEAILGINGSADTVALLVNAGGTVNISGYQDAANVLPNVYVTMAGGSMNLGGNTAPAAGTLRLDADATLNEMLTVSANTTIDTNGSTLTVKPAAGETGISVGAATLTLAGKADAGALIVDGSNTTEGSPRGINCAGNLNIQSGTVTVENSYGYGIGGDAIGGVFKMTGGTLNVTDCGKGAEGGFIWSSTADDASCQFLAGTVNMTGCGSTGFGCIYAQCPVTFGDGTSALTVNLENNPNSTGVKNAIVLENGKNLTINKNAVVHITIAGKMDTCRAINIGKADSTVALNGGTLDISKDSACTATTVCGIRGSSGCMPKLTVTTDSILNVVGCTSKNALPGMIVTITGGSMNLGTDVDGKNVSTAAAAGATSITNGEDAVTLQKQSANAYSAAISKTPADSVYPYTYTAHVSSDGVYAWIPVSFVNFYDSNRTTLLGFCTAAGETTWGTAKTAAPDMTSHTNFNGWVNASGAALSDSAAATLAAPLNVYASYTSPSDSGGSSGGTTDIPDPTVPLANLPSALNSTDHFAYVQGYKDGTVRPNSNITRAEVATMFYRLLTTERRDEIFTAKNSYSDVPASAWCNKAVSSMTAGKYILGYRDGTFGPDRDITRAEFVSIAVRFMDAKEGTVKFTDVPANYWAHDAISTAVAYGWIDGYSDGTFRPGQPITRAEVMKIINTMLGRGTDAKGVLTGTRAWSDCSDSNAWYYYEVTEATNNHAYSGARPSETWKSLSIPYTYSIAKYENP